MNILNEDELRMLAEECERGCVSIYLPTHRAGKEAEGDSISLKNLLDEAEERLIARGLGPPEVQDLLEPARTLVVDDLFWQHQSDGLALFISPGFLRYYRLPLPFEELVVVGDRFHLKPLLSLFSADGRFYILALSQDEVRLLQGSRYSVGEINLEEAPSRLAEALKWDEMERQTQFHTTTATPQGRSAPRGARGGRPAVFHGHGVESGADHKEHVLRYFQRVDEGVREILGGERAPLVLAAVDYLHPIYEQANDYPRLLEEGIVGNPENLSAGELHERAWAIVEPIFARDREEAAEGYRQLAGEGSDRASGSVEEIVPAAAFGRVDTLFVALGVHVWGAFDPDENAVAVHEEAEPGDADLLDLAAVHTLLNSGTTYAVDADQVPGESPAAALFRY